MSGSAQFTIGSEVVCSDGVCGELRRVVIDPIARALTHLVVEERHRQGDGRLVPVDLVESAAVEIRLRCTMAEFKALEDAEETRFLPGAPGDWDYHQEQMLSLPIYGLGMGARVPGGDPNVGPQTVISDSVPAGEVEVRRGDRVRATDGAIGHIQGLVVEPRNQHVTHVLLREGHLWGKKTVAIPIGAVKDVTDGVRLSITKDEVGALPPVDLAEHQ